MYLSESTRVTLVIQERLISRTGRKPNFAGRFGNYFVCGNQNTQEVQKHRTPSDAWMVYRNKVYDVSDWHEVSISEM